MHSVQRAGRYVTYLTEFLFIRRREIELVSKMGAHSVRCLLFFLRD